MTMLKGSPRIIEVRFNVFEATIYVTIKRIQKETSAYYGNTYKLNADCDRAKQLARILPEPERNSITWKPDVMMYEPDKHI